MRRIPSYNTNTCVCVLTRSSAVQQDVSARVNIYQKHAIRDDNRSTVGFFLFFFFRLSRWFVLAPRLQSLSFCPQANRLNRQTYNKTAVDTAVRLTFRAARSICVCLQFDAIAANYRNDLTIRLREFVFSFLFSNTV